MKALETAREAIKQLQAGSGGRLTSLSVPRRVAQALRRELKLAPTADIVVDGVPVLEMERRVELIHMAVAFAAIRWDVEMTHEDAASLLKAVPTEELLDLVPLVVNQHLDDRGFDDPLDGLNAEGVKEMKDKIKGLGFDDSSI